MENKIGRQKSTNQGTYVYTHVVRDKKKRVVFGFSFGSFLICHICIWCSNSSVTVIIFVKGLERNTDQWLLLGCYYWKWITAMTTSMYVCVSLPFNFLFLSLFLFKGSVSWEKNTLWELHLVSNMYFLSFMLFNFCSVVLFGAWSRFPWNSWDFAWNISVFLVIWFVHVWGLLTFVLLLFFLLFLWTLVGLEIFCSWLLFSLEMVDSC